MAHIIPDNRKLSPPEKRFLNHIKNDSNTKDWIVFPRLPLKRKTKKYAGTDIDFLILAPQLGFIFCEIKGNHKIENGKWYFTYDGKNWKEADSPLDTINDTKFAFGRYLKERFNKNSPLHNIIMADFVIFPRNNFIQELPLEDSKTRIIDQNDLKNNVFSVFQERIEALHSRAKKKGLRFNAPDKSQCKLIKSDIYPDTIEDKYLRILTDDTILKIEKYTEDQKEVIRAIDHEKKIFITGGASTGKSIIVQSLALKYKKEGKSVYYFVPTIALQEEINHNLSNSLEYKNKSFYEFGVNTLAQAKMKFFGDKNTIGDTKNIPDSQKRDVLIVDEVQDSIDDDHLEFFDAIVREGLDYGRFIFCGDIGNQAIVNKNLTQKGVDTLKSFDFLFPELKKNCRNPKKIMDFLNKETGIPLPEMKFRSEESPDVQHLSYDSADEAIHGLCKRIKWLLNKSIREDEITIILKFAKGNIVKLLKEVGDKYNIGFKYSNRYTHVNEHSTNINVYSVLQFRGCESNWVIAFGSNRLNDDQKYIAYTRAKAGLITISKKKKKDLPANAKL